MNILFFNHPPGKDGLVETLSATLREMCVEGGVAVAESVVVSPGREQLQGQPNILVIDVDLGPDQDMLGRAQRNALALGLHEAVLPRLPDEWKVRAVVHPFDSGKPGYFEGVAKRPE